MFELDSDFVEHGTGVVVSAGGVAEGQESVVHEGSQDRGTAPGIQNKV